MLWCNPWPIANGLELLIAFITLHRNVSMQRAFGPYFFAEFFAQSRSSRQKVGYRLFCVQKSFNSVSLHARPPGSPHLYRENALYGILSMRRPNATNMLHIEIFFPLMTDGRASFIFRSPSAECPPHSTPLLENTSNFILTVLWGCFHHLHI